MPWFPRNIQPEKYIAIQPRTLLEVNGKTLLCDFCQNNVWEYVGRCIDNARKLFGKLINAYSLSQIKPDMFTTEYTPHKKNLTGDSYECCSCLRKSKIYKIPYRYIDDAVAFYNGVRQDTTMPETKTKKARVARMRDEYLVVSDLSEEIKRKENDIKNCEKDIGSCEKEITGHRKALKDLGIKRFNE